MDQETLDKFLDDATHKLRAMWEAAGGSPIEEQELDSLNDLLTAFFVDKVSP
jgi:hypothetical protein